MKGAKGVIISITGGEDMRLMEVDEAASHIKELVDPDANIIWGSAFNNDLDGKIRVSVVATGIEAEAVTQPQPGKVFAFPRTTAATTVTPMAIATAPASVTEETVAAQDEEEETLELGDESDGDELLLDSDDVLTAPVGSAPIAPPTDEEELTEVASPEEKPKVRESGTLFERMSNIARGAAQAQVDEEETPNYRREPLDIPRFLNRQNNQ
jgi:cell division protein FtsZ